MQKNTTKLQDLNRQKQGRWGDSSFHLGESKSMNQPNQNEVDGCGRGMDDPPVAPTSGSKG
jgi:hypothetical protein